MEEAMEIGKAAAKTKLQALTAEQDKLTSNFSSHTTPKLLAKHHSDRNTGEGKPGFSCRQ